MEGARGDPLAQPGGTEPPAQLASGLAGEREGQCVTGIGRAGGDAIGDPAGEHPSLA